MLAPARDAAATIETFSGVISRHPRVLDTAAVADISATLEENDFRHRTRLATDPAVVQGVSAALASSRDRLTAVKLFALPEQPDGDFSLVEDGLRRTYKRCRKGFAAATVNPTVEAFHRWRKDVKYLRYQLEALVPYAPVPLGERASDLDTTGRAARIVTRPRRTGTRAERRGAIVSRSSRSDGPEFTLSADADGPRCAQPLRNPDGRDRFRSSATGIRSECWRRLHEARTCGDRTSGLRDRRSRTASSRRGRRPRSHRYSRWHLLRPADLTAEHCRGHP